MRPTHALIIIITSCACARGKAIGSIVVIVVVVLIIVDTKIAKSGDLSTSVLLAWRTCRIWQKFNWLQCAQNRVARPTGITNSVSMLAIIAMPINSAHYAYDNMCITYSVLTCTCATGLICIGKGSVQLPICRCKVCTGYVLYRALIINVTLNLYTLAVPY